jgi:hypothetical protein
VATAEPAAQISTPDSVEIERIAPPWTISSECALARANASLGAPAKFAVRGERVRCDQIHTETRQIPEEPSKIGAITIAVTEIAQQKTRGDSLDEMLGVRGRVACICQSRGRDPMLKPTCALTLLALCSPALGAGQPAAQQQADSSTQAQHKPDGQRVICEDQEVIGSRLGVKRVCLTADQWRQQQLDSRDATDMQQRTGPHG